MTMHGSPQVASTAAAAPPTLLERITKLEDMLGIGPQEGKMMDRVLQIEVQLLGAPCTGALPTRVAACEEGMGI